MSFVAREDNYYILLTANLHVRTRPHRARSLSLCVLSFSLGLSDAEGRRQKLCPPCHWRRRWKDGQGPQLAHQDSWSRSFAEEGPLLSVVVKYHVLFEVTR